MKALSILLFAAIRFTGCAASRGTKEITGSKTFRNIFGSVVMMGHLQANKVPALVFVSAGAYCRHGYCGKNKTLNDALNLEQTKRSG